jgi:hypothetical protein
MQNDTYKDVYGEIVIPNLNAYQQAFDLPKDVMDKFNYLYATLLTDYLLAEYFEGNVPRYKFRPEQWSYSKQTMFGFITLPYALDR